MYIYTDNQGYIISYALIGMFEDGIQVEDPVDIEHFEKNWESYRFDGEMLTYDKEHSKIIELKHQKEYFRMRRNKICFPIVNRGNVWYRTLSDKQQDELFQWYKDWLNVTDTLVEPKLLDWLSSEEIIEK